MGLCGHYDGGDLCGARSEKRYLPGWRCPNHTPCALAGKPEVVPDPARTVEALSSRRLVDRGRVYGVPGTTDSPRLQADGATALPPRDESKRRK